MRSISDNGLTVIKHFEGLRLETYIDPVGVLTIGYGHTGAHAVPGNKITEAQANKILKADLEETESYLDSVVPPSIQSERFAALVSLAFNIGHGAFGKSTLLKRLSEGRLDDAAAEFSRWVFGTINGKKVSLPGLVRRRKSERYLFESGQVNFFDAQKPQVFADSDDLEEISASSALFSAGDPSADFAQHFASWGVRNFKPYELLVMGSSHSNPNSPAFGLNTLPPKDLWDNIKLTIQVLDKLRDQFMAPIRTLSVYRSENYNRAIGGETNSLHKRFNAIDFYVQSNSSPSSWAGVLRDMRDRGDFKGGIGTYGSFVHLDTRGSNADW
ncbi:MAG TPA: glycoside hydrolase family protein [Bosea sp. (in: a-proteobacteria)]|jgi:lysozyme|uniref:glycoside hydrolase family protein n=1 Tax=Bosea sp. (in: a-proteobacteria) TaxID=1871050 RepID=UPI002DDD1F63|nr:glycoside hydrolase family protein [Bosea sp. (in: a-proteobacteria)]HEV2555001.1 glycoside hydrolase family protein [Bosea sp. (in: a-proteobacteria)]